MIYTPKLEMRRYAFRDSSPANELREHNRVEDPGMIWYDSEDPNSISFIGSSKDNDGSCFCGKLVVRSNAWNDWMVAVYGDNSGLIRMRRTHAPLKTLIEYAPLKTLIEFGEQEIFRPQVKKLMDIIKSGQACAYHSKVDDYDGPIVTVSKRPPKVASYKQVPSMPVSMSYDERLICDADYRKAELSRYWRIIDLRAAVLHSQQLRAWNKDNPDVARVLGGFEARMRRDIEDELVSKFPELKTFDLNNISAQLVGF